MKTIIEISNRHIHLDKETKNILFGKKFKFSIKRELSQKGEYSTDSTVTIKTDKATIEEVRVLGPLREYTQLEISKSDALYLGLNPPYRNSGDLNGSENITIIGPKGEIYKENCVIIAKRHMHLDPQTAKENKLSNNDRIEAKINGKRMTNIFVKIKEGYSSAIHVDKDDAEKFNIIKTETAEVTKDIKESDIMVIILEVLMIILMFDYLLVLIFKTYPIFSYKEDIGGNTVYRALGYEVWKCKDIKGYENIYIESYKSKFSCPVADYEIEDRTEKTCEDALMYIYEDINYKYYFDCLRNVYVRFSDGEELDVAEALKLNIVTIEELTQKGLKIYKEKK